MSPKKKLSSFVVKSHTIYLISFGLNYKLCPLILSKIQFSLVFKLHFCLIQFLLLSLFNSCLPPRSNFLPDGIFEDP